MFWLLSLISGFVQSLFGVKIGYGYECTQEQIKTITAADVTHQTNCPLRNWIPIMLRESTHFDNITVVIIGCNKGDDFISLMNAFSGNEEYNIVEYVKRLEQSKVTNFACGKAATKVMLPGQTLRPTQGYCIEPMKSTFNVVENIMNDMKLDMNSVHLIRAAIDAFPGIVDFPNDSAGKEYLGLGHTAADLSKNGTMVSTNVTNLDVLFMEHQINYVDFLSIDAEGYDSQVIIGMLKVLAFKKIRFLEFEYHKVGSWANADLKMILEILDEFGFDCFWQGNFGQLWRATGCWTPTHSQRRYWSNIVCVNRNEKNAHKEMVEMS
mmetsp:Transcript_15217/g.22414  ORF Transcript_15217/g.22414 Transcript_15217/m.22414 type:complete len:323 (-) Transcript_15217:179-1147(-)